MIYLHKNVPSVYVDESRDFQLLCRLYDCIENGVKFNIDMLSNIIDTRACDEVLMTLLQSKVGFYTDHKYPNKQMQTVLDAFPYLMKNKGSKKSIVQAVNIFLRINNIKTTSIIEIINKQDGINRYMVRIGIGATYMDTTILSEIFRYILPTGYEIYYYFYDDVNVTDDKLIYNDDVNVVILNEQEAAHIIDADFNTLGDYVGISDAYSDVHLADTVNVVQGYYDEDTKSFYSDMEHQQRIIPINNTNTIYFLDLTNFSSESVSTEEVLLATVSAQETQSLQTSEGADLLVTPETTSFKKYYIYNSHKNSDGQAIGFELVPPIIRFKVPKSITIDNTTYELTVSARIGDRIVLDGDTCEYGARIDYSISGGPTSISTFFIVTNVNPTIYYTG